MNWRTPRLGLPLLAKELVEQASRPRTYVVRIVYATLLFVIAFWQFERILANSGASTFSALGSGKLMFEQVVLLQLLGVLLFLPPLSCGAITSEKERDSLAVLLVTRLGPFTILFEKLLGRLVPMLSFLLLSMPLLAFAYSLGGVSIVELISGICLLAVICVHIGTLGLMCSSWAGTTVSAFIGTYTIGLISCPVLAVVAMTTATATIGKISPLTLTTDNSQLLAIQSAVLLVPAVSYFLLGRYFLVHRAQVARKNLVLELFRRLDRFFFWLNDITTGGVVLIRDDALLPDFMPITWRETQKKSLGTTRYLVRVLVSIETPLFLILAAVAGMAYQTRLGVAAEALYVVWALGVLLITVQATSLISSERSHQTLDLLLASTMDSHEIVRQKHLGIRRLMLVLTVPLVTIFLFEAWFATGTPGLEDGALAIITVPLATVVAVFQHFDYFLCALLSVLVYLPLCSWIAFVIGIKSRSQMRAMLITLMVLFGWAFLPVLVAGKQAEMITLHLLEKPLIAVPALLCSPSVMIMMNETRGLAEPLTYGGISPILLFSIVNFSFYGLVWYGLRRRCLSQADRLLGRLSGHTAATAATAKEPAA